MTEKQTLLAAFGGQFISGAFTKQDGTHRPFWGVLKNEPSVPDHIIVTFDLRKKQYRRFDLRKPYALVNKKMVGCTLLEGKVAPTLALGESMFGGKA